MGIAVLVVAALVVKGLPGQSPAQYTRSVIRNESNQFLYRSFELDRIMAPENGPARGVVMSLQVRTVVSRPFDEACKVIRRGTWW